MILIIIELLKASPLIIASCTAIYGINSWRREYKWKRQAELAEEVLSLFYEARDAIKQIRIVFAHAGEGTCRKQSENESPDEKKAYDRAYVVFERYNAKLELFSRLHSLRYRFMAQFGKDSGEPFVALRKILDEILSSAQILSKLWAKQRTHFRTEKAKKEHFEFMNKLEAIFWEGLADEDPINPKLEKCVQDIEVICSRILSEKSIFKSIKENHLVKKLKQKIANEANSADAKSRVATGMNTLALGVILTDDTLTVDLLDGRTVSVPLGWFPRLVHASIKERQNWKLTGKGQGIHWQDIDEDISIEAILAGIPSVESQESLKKWLAGRKP